MFRINLFAIAYIIILHLTLLAQTNDSISSTDVSTDCGLIFGKEVDYKSQDSSYTDVIQLLGLSDKAQAIQFKILVNKAPDDNTIIIFKDIQKGSDLSDLSWLMDFNVIKGPIEANGASKDEIYAVLYSQNLDGGLLPGDYKQLFNVKYELANISGSQKDIKSSMKISNTVASTSLGVAIDISPSRDELKIYLKR